MCMYTSSRGKSNRSHSKTEFQMFSLISGRHVGAPQRGTNMASPYWALQICVEPIGLSRAFSYQLNDSQVYHIDHRWRIMLLTLRVKQNIFSYLKDFSPIHRYFTSVSMPESLTPRLNTTRNTGSPGSMYVSH